MRLIFIENVATLLSAMTFLSADEAAKLSLSEARNKAFEYSKQLKENYRLLSLSEALNRDLEDRLKKLMNELGAKNQEVLLTAEQLNQLRGSAFGPSSERRADDDLPLFKKKADELETLTRKKRTEFGRREQPKLPEVEVLHELSEEEMKAAGLKKWEGQFEVSELINVSPARIILEIHKRQKYLRDTSIAANEKGCVPAAEPGSEAKAPSQQPDMPPIVTASGPLKLKEGSRYSLEFGVETGLNKYCFHLPLDRQVQMYKQYGLNVDSQTLFSQIDLIAWYLKTTVFQGIVAKIKSDKVNLADETPWGNLKKKENGKKNKKFYLWGVRNEKAVCFEIFDSRSGRAAKAFLSDLEGTLVTDGYKVYQQLASAKLVIANDWYHVRRKFILSEKSFPEESKYFIDQIRELSRIEADLKGKPPDEILKVRTEKSKPIVDAIKEKLESFSSILPESSLGKAVRYTLGLWTGLNVFLSNPLVPMDTNGIERTLRGPVVGRKNHYGSKSLKSAEVAAIWYSVIETCKANGVDPKEYITETLKAILQKKPVLMPWEWPKTSTPP
jgi:transposase